jgi:uncharacterized membrane protein
LVELGDKEKEDFDILDFTIITQLANGKRGLTDLSGAVNVRQHDLAVHLFKLASQEYLSYNIRNGTVDITLTEKGFLQVKSGMPKPKAQEQAKQQAQMQDVTQGQGQAGKAIQQEQVSTAQMQEHEQTQQIQAGAAEQEQAQNATSAQQLEANLEKAKKQGTIMIAGATIVIAIIVIILVLIYTKIL